MLGVRRAIPPRICAVCSKEYIPASGPQKFCSAECHKSVLRLRSKTRYNAAHRQFKYQTNGFAYSLNLRYGLGADKHYDYKLREQYECCAICGRNKSEFDYNLGLDHNHSTGQLRGVLCRHCNVVIGILETKSDIVQSALQYLEKYNVAE